MPTNLSFAAPAGYNTATPKFGAAAVSVANHDGEQGVGGKIPATGGWAAECWAKTTDTAVRVALSQQDAFWIGQDGSGKAIANFGTTALNSTVTVNDGAYHHFAISADAAGASFFVDGVKVATTTTTESAAGVDRTAHSIAIGGFQNVGSFVWNGSIDEVAVWSANKYSANFTPPTGAYAGSESALLYLYHLDSNGTDSAGGVDCGSGSYQAGLDGTDFTTATDQACDGTHPYGKTNGRLAAEMVRQINNALQPRRFNVTIA